MAAMMLMLINLTMIANIFMSFNLIVINYNCFTTFYMHPNFLESHTLFHNLAIFLNKHHFILQSGLRTIIWLAFGLTCIITELSTVLFEAEFSTG